jgi:hypothetical protein
MTTEAYAGQCVICHAPLDDFGREVFGGDDEVTARDDEYRAWLAAQDLAL